MSKSIEEEYIELASDYGVDVEEPKEFYVSLKTLLVEIMKHVHRLDGMVYNPRMQIDEHGNLSPLILKRTKRDERSTDGSFNNELHLVDIPGEIDKILDSLPDDDDGHEHEPLLSPTEYNMTSRAQRDFMEKAYNDGVATIKFTPGEEPEVISVDEMYKHMHDYVDKPQVLSDEQIAETNTELNKQLFTCGNCVRHGKHDCPLDRPNTIPYRPNAIPSWQHEICSEFKHNLLSDLIETMSNNNE